MYYLGSRWLLWKAGGSGETEDEDEDKIVLFSQDAVAGPS